jgi:outer membrane protein assembly factor BamB
MASPRLTLVVVAVFALTFLASASARIPGSIQPTSGSSPRSLAAGDDAWLQYGADPQQTNSVAVGLTPNAARGLHVRWQAQLDGPVVASPLYYGGLAYVATEAGTVYALDAITGEVVWQRSFGSISLGPDCGSWGVSSTGAIDPDRGVLYVAGSDGMLQALDLKDGSTADGWPIQISNRPDTEYVWGGLRLVGDRLYVPVASYCDGPDALGRPATGRIVAVNVATQSVDASFLPAGQEFALGGVWGYGGVSVEPDGSALWTAVGNSDVWDASCGCSYDGAGFGDSIVQLTPDLVPLQSDRPTDVPLHDDFDFGAAPMLFQPSGCPAFAAANNKDDLLYVWQRTNLAAGPVFEDGIGSTGAPFVGAPSWSPSLRILFDAGTRVVVDGQNTGDGVNAFTVDSSCRIQPLWQTVTGQGTMPSPLVLGNVVVATGGYAGGITALDARTGAKLWASTTAGPALSPPIWAGTEILVADFGGTVTAIAP